MVYSPLEICIGITNGLASRIAIELAGLRTWCAVEKSGDIQSEIDMMVAEPGEGAFATISVSCFIPDDGFGKRFVECQVNSNDWGGSEFPNLNTPRVLDLLRQSAREFGRATVSLVTSYRTEPPGEDNPVTRYWVRVQFGSIVGEIDLSQDELVDEEAIADDLVADLTRLYRLKGEISSNGKG